MRISLFFLFLFIQLNCIFGNNHYVSSTASISGSGTQNDPWPFQTALNHPAALKPGDTVWLRGGIYKNNFDAQTNFNCKTNGAENAPIIFRNYKNERATIDGELTYSLYAGLGNCSYTWFWGLEVTNTASLSRNVTIGGSVTCTAENMKFINMIVHDLGSGIDLWKTAKNSETYGCIIYHIGNNLNNNGNWEGHGHGMYLQNDTFGVKNIHNNIVFSTYGYGIKVWQTTTTAPIGNFDFQKNIVFNGGAASDNMGGVGNNSRTHNFFVVSNSVGNPVVNTVIKHNYTYSGNNTPRPPVNAFGLNYGVKKMILDSNYLTCQTRLGFNNTPVFNASVKDNKIIGGIPPVYGIYLWGFLQTDFPNNTFESTFPSGLEYFILPNRFEHEKSHIAIYNWDSLENVSINVAKSGIKSGDQYMLINVMDYYNDTLTGICGTDGNIVIPMTGRTFAKAIGSPKNPVSQFPKFGVFILTKKSGKAPVKITNISTHSNCNVFPNPSSGKITISECNGLHAMEVYNLFGQKVFSVESNHQNIISEMDLSDLGRGIYTIKFIKNEMVKNQRLVIQ